MAPTKGKTERIAKKITLPSPTFQKFLKELMFNEETYLAFLENPAGSFQAHGIGLGTDVSEKMIVDFRYALDHARETLAKSKGKLQFEDVFKIPLVSFKDGRLQLKQRNVAAGTSVDVYYSEKTSSENRGSVTDFSAGMTPTKSTDHWSTKNFGGTSIFEQVSQIERFDRCPLLSAETIREVTKAISVNKVVR